MGQEDDVNDTRKVLQSVSSKEEEETNRNRCYEQESDSEPLNYGVPLAGETARGLSGAGVLVGVVTCELFGDCGRATPPLLLATTELVLKLIGAGAVGPGKVSQRVKKKKKGPIPRSMNGKGTIFGQRERKKEEE